MSESRTFTAVILPTVAEQLEEGDLRAIDPNSVDLTEWEDGHPSPLFAGGNYDLSSIVGVWSNPRVEDERLLVDVRLQPELERDMLDDLEKGRERMRFSFAGIHAGGVARLISVDVHGLPPVEKR